MSKTGKAKTGKEYLNQILGRNPDLCGPGPYVHDQDTDGRLRRGGHFVSEADFIIIGRALLREADQLFLTSQTVYSSDNSINEYNTYYALWIKEPTVDVLGKPLWDDSGVVELMKRKFGVEFLAWEREKIRQKKYQSRTYLPTEEPVKEDCDEETLVDVINQNGFSEKENRDAELLAKRIDPKTRATSRYSRVPYRLTGGLHLSYEYEAIRFDKTDRLTETHIFQLKG